MNKKILLLLLAVILISGGVFYFAKLQRKTVSENSEVQKETDQQSKNSSPSEQFINQSAHEVKDAYDQEAQLKANGGGAGSIAQVEICSGSQSNTFDCYEDYYFEMVKKEGIRAAFTDIHARYETNAYVKSQCHPLTHIIGRAAAGLYEKVADAYVQGDSFCWSGYYHGVLEGVIGKVGRSSLVSQLNDICSGVSGKANYSFDYYNCVHGLGHGVMVYTNNDLFEALTLCDNLKGSWEQTSCHSGVFMENIIIDNKNHFTEYLKPSDPVYPCNAVGDQYKQTCYLMQTSYMLKVTNQNFSKVFDLCATVESAFRATCYQSLGRDASGHSISNREATKASCNLGKDYEQKSNCIIGAVKDFVSYFHSDIEAKALCASLETDLQKVCYSTVESYYKNF